MKYLFAVLWPAVMLTVSHLRVADAEPNASGARPLSERLFQGMDKNTDGAISRGEATGAVKAHFDRIDADSNGRISPRELHDAVVARAKRQRGSRSVEKTPGRFQRPQPKHQTSRPVPTPWLGYGHDDHPDIRGATYLKSPEQIPALLDGSNRKPEGALSYPKGSGLRIVGTGHSWMRPGYSTLPAIARAAGLEQQLRVNSRGGEAGAARMMWEYENGILSSRGRANPVCMAAITTGQWDVMMWGGYTNDRPTYYLAWIDFCLKHNSKMEFYRFNGWPQWAHGFGDGDREPKIENYRAKARRTHERTAKLVAELDKRYPNKVHILPTSEAMLLALEHYFEGKLPGIVALDQRAERKGPAIWRDGGHLDAPMAWLEGYVFYATLYQKSPELIKGRLDARVVSNELDAVFRKIAWQAVINNPLSDVTDRNGNGIGDALEK
jgi:hypothetical protein